MDPELRNRLLALEDALALIASLPRRAGLFEAQRIAKAALGGEPATTTATGPSLSDPIYYTQVRRSLEKKWRNRCAYCGADGVVLEIEHAKPVSRGGGDEYTNLLLACHDCNQRKGTQTLAEFGFEELSLLLAGQVMVR